MAKHCQHDFVHSKNISDDSIEVMIWNRLIKTRKNIYSNMRWTLRNHFIQRSGIFQNWKSEFRVLDNHSTRGMCGIRPVLEGRGRNKLVSHISTLHSSANQTAWFVGNFKSFPLPIESLQFRFRGYLYVQEINLWPYYAEDWK